MVRFPASRSSVICVEVKAVGWWWWWWWWLLSRYWNWWQEFLKFQSPLTFEEKEEELLRIYSEAWYYKGPWGAWQKKEVTFLPIVSVSFPKETLQKLSRATPVSFESPSRRWRGMEMPQRCKPPAECVLDIFLWKTLLCITWVGPKAATSAKLLFDANMMTNHLFCGLD